MNKENDLISIIIPVFNVEKYIVECIESVINQTYMNLEIILIDDGSQDSCPEICESYKERDNRIKVIHKKNGGLSSARNAGMKMATGKYIGFVDSDDYCDVTMFEKLYNNMLEYNADISICGYYDLFPDYKSTKYLSNEIVELSREKALDLLFDDRTFQNFVWNKLYKKDTLKDVSFPEGVTFEDIATEHVIFSHAHKLVYFISPLYYYRRRNSSISTSFNPQKIRDLYKVICIRENSEEAVGRDSLINGNRIALCIDIQKNRKFIKDENKQEINQIYSKTIEKIRFNDLIFTRKIEYLVLRYVPFLIKPLQQGLRFMRYLKTVLNHN